MPLQTREFGELDFNPTLGNPLLLALQEKAAAIAAMHDFEAMSVLQIADIASNPAGFYPREQSWLAVQHLCAKAMSRVLSLGEGGATH